MERLANPEPESQHQQTSFQGFRQNILDWLNIPVWQRWVNKKLNYPTTPDVSILSTLLADLKDATERELSQPLARVAITTPSIPALTPEDINDALEYVGLASWMGEPEFYPSRIVEADAVNAATGHGLCSNYKDLFSCWDDFDELVEMNGFSFPVGAPTPTLFFVSFTRHHLYTSIIRPTSGKALDWLTQDKVQILDFDAGLDKFTSEDEGFWDRLRGRILELPRAWPRSVDRVLVAGECVMDYRFCGVLEDVLAGLNQGRGKENLLGSETGVPGLDPTFAAARGAAVFARRRQEVQGDCTELEKCEVERRGGGLDRVKSELR